LSSEIIREVSDDISSDAFLTRLFSVAALLRLLTYVPALPASEQSYFTYNSLLPCEGCQLYTIMFRRTKSVPREPKSDPPKNTSVIVTLKADAPYTVASPWVFPRRMYTNASSKTFAFLYLLLIDSNRVLLHPLLRT
jgi:hypothetical protein